MLFICLFSFLSSLSDLIGRVFGRFKQTLGGKRGCRVDSKYLFCNHKYSPMRNLPCGKLTDYGKPRLPRRFQMLFVCNHMRNLPFPASGSPSARFATRIRTTANLVCRVDSAQGQQKTRSQHLMCWLRVFLVAPCGIEPQILP